MDRGSAGYSLQRAGLACLGFLGTIGLFVLAGCPANLENPDQVIVAPTNAAAGSGAGGAPIVDNTDLTCVSALFKKSCTTIGCHGSGATAAAGLDLASPGFAARMVDVAATHQLVDPGATCPAAKLIDSANPTMSWLLVKTGGTQGTCGSAMPLGTMGLENADKTCITTFVTAEAALHSGMAAGTAGAPAAGTAGAAAAGASSGGSGGASAGSGGM